MKKEIHFLPTTSPCGDSSFRKEEKLCRVLAKLQLLMRDLLDSPFYILYLITISLKSYFLVG
jgi:hypothetical protein